MRRALLLAAALLFVACGRDTAVSPPAKDTSVGPPEPPPRRQRGDVGRSVSLETDAGAIHCTLDATRAPRAVALFTGLATGRARWRDPIDGGVRKDPLYRDLPFHRVIAGVLIQGGCPRGDGMGHPGYRIAVEASDAERLGAPGALVLARYTPPPGRDDPAPPPPGHVLGSQFGITLTAMPQLVGQVTVLGRCDDLEIVRAIAATADAAARPRLRRVHVLPE